LHQSVCKTAIIEGAAAASARESYAALRRGGGSGSDLRGTVVLQQSRSQKLCEYPLECFKIVDIFLQDPKNNASIDL
jgi:hypothetical protein